ncbi:uncharacterized protein LOC142189604 [Leptodactylus fuscus]|uniref:uncharacterized protein LOC142189604 n=1 Tax=Leptodactylus fuscus TaxID=238119 RepID=UPI003F4EA67F
MDLKDTYLHLPILPAYKKYVRIAADVEGQLRHLQFSTTEVIHHGKFPTTIGRERMVAAVKFQLVPRPITIRNRIEGVVTDVGSRRCSSMVDSVKRWKVHSPTSLDPVNYRHITLRLGTTGTIFLPKGLGIFIQWERTRVVCLALLHFANQLKDKAVQHNKQNKGPGDENDSCLIPNGFLSNIIVSELSVTVVTLVTLKGYFFDMSVTLCKPQREMRKHHGNFSNKSAICECTLRREESISGPSVFPLVPCCDSLQSDTVSIGCLSTGYTPTPIDVTWNSGSITSEIRTFPAVLGRQGTYLSASLLTIPASEWTSNKKYVCNVNHTPSGTKVDKEVEACEVKAIEPKVSVMQASCGESGSVDLVCLISEYTPKEINVQWLLNGEPTSIIPKNTPAYRENDGTYGSRSEVSVPKEDWYAGDIYTCKVNHPASKTKTESSIQKCPAPGNMIPKVTILPPSPKDILITNQPKLVCQVSQVESPYSLTINWTREDGKKPLVFTLEPERDHTGGFTVRSVLKLSLSDWKTGKEFTCSVQYEDLSTPIEKTIKYSEDQSIHPSVNIFPPSAEELSNQDFVGIVSLIKGFKPKPIHVQWMKNGVVLDEEYYTNTAAVPLDDETYYMFSILTVEKSDWIRGATFTCNAVHSKITSKDIKRSKGKFEPIIPEVFPLIPTGQISNTNAILACLIRGYYPNIVSISWSTTDGDKLSDVNNFISIIPGSPPYTVVSQATDNNGNVNSKTYQCSAISKSISITKIVPKGCDAPPEKPSVEIWQGTCPESNGELEITCQAYNLTSQGATIKWYINGQERTSPKDEVDFGKSQNHFFAMKSTITISLFQWNNGATVKCHVTDPITKKTAEGTIKKCSDSLNCLGINVFMVPPSIEDLYVFNTARILCVAYNLKDPNENYSFKWNVPGTHSDALNVQNENPELHDNGTCSITSVLTVTPDDWNRQTEFTCVFSYKDLQTPIIKRMKKENVAKMSKPVINMIPPSEEEIAQKETCTVGCIISNFNPINIYVGWTDDGMEVYKENFVSSKPKLETNRYTYFIMSKLTIPCSSWENGRRYSCVVGHDTFPMKFITKSIDKSAGKPTVINMVVSMSDTTLSCS